MDLERKALELRKDVLTLVYRSKRGHLGGDLSVLDILVALYYKHLNCTPQNFTSPERDRFLLSKGHCAEALYCVLADRGFFPKSDLEGYCAMGSRYIGHPSNKVCGVEMCAGSLGHGLPLGVGMALAAKMDGLPYYVYTVLGDGELAEGSVWEGAMAAAHFGLDHLIAVIDRNGLQISGSTEEVMAQEDLESRWAAFGWRVLHAPGNEVKALDKALAVAKQASGAPTVIIAHTTKGSGVSFMENKAGWHHRVPNSEEYEAAMQQLERRVQQCR